MVYTVIGIYSATAEVVVDIVNVRSGRDAVYRAAKAFYHKTGFGASRRAACLIVSIFGGAHNDLAVGLVDKSNLAVSWEEIEDEHT